MTVDVSAVRRIAVEPTALLGVAAVAVFAIWCEHDGGYDPLQWLPGTLLLAGVLAASFGSHDTIARLRAAPLAPAFLGAYAAWSFCSIAWAQVKGDALDGANRTLLYAIVFLLFRTLPVTARTQKLLMVLWAIVVGALVAVHVAGAVVASGPTGHFVLGRLARPITYPNADAAVSLMAAFIALVASTNRRTSILVRGLLGGGACFLTEAALSSQSRGSLFAVPVTIAVWLLVSGQVLRTLAHVATLAISIAPAVPRLFRVYTSVVHGTGYDSTLHAAATAIVATSLLATALFTALAFADQRVELSGRTRSRIGQGVAAAAAACLVAVAVYGIGFAHVDARIHRAWEDFTLNRQAPRTSIHLTSGIGTSRYDVWRIAIDQFRTHPIGGVGADNYLVGYLEHRRTGETARYPESVELRALSETGLVGGALFLAFLVAALRPAIRRSRAAPGAAATIGISVFAYWFAHASVDWLWEFPALAAPAFAFLGLAGNAAPASAAGARGLRWLVAGAAAVVAVFVAVAPPWLSARQVAEANAAPAAPRAYALLRAAARWNRLSDAPYLAAATIAANDGDRPLEAAYLRRALTRDRVDWYTHLMLGIVAGREHRTGDARRALAAARALSPLDPVVIYAQRRLHWGIPLTEREVGAIFRLRSRTLRGVAQR